MTLSAAQNATLKGLHGRHLLSMKEMPFDTVDAILSSARSMERLLLARAPLTVARGRLLASLFFEPSTRTRFSFESAMLRLGGAVFGFGDAGQTRAGAPASPETLEDTARVIAGYADIAVFRHGSVGAIGRYAAYSSIPVINAGNGVGPDSEHPTQALTDLYTLEATLGRIDGLRVLVIGGLQLRAAHSLLLGLALFNQVLVYLLCPSEYYWSAAEAADLEARGLRFSFVDAIADVIGEVDVIYHNGFSEEPDPKNASLYKVTRSSLRDAKPNLIVMHCLPREGEIDETLDDLPCALYFRQSNYGVPVRMALLSALLGLQPIG